MTSLGEGTGRAAAKLTSRFPELGAGGFTRVDGTVQFYVRVRALLAELDEPTVVDLGAGRGAGASSPVPIHRHLLDLRPLAKQVIGVDIDPAVEENPLVDTAHVIEESGVLPLADASVDLVVADHTFEHITDPTPVAAELTRVLRPGGWLCARTPNRWGYIALAAKVVPNRLHALALERLQPDRESRDVFPTAYRLNTPKAIRKHFPADRFDSIIIGWEPELAYGAGSRLASACSSVIARLTPERLRPVLLVFMRRVQT